MMNRTKSIRGGFTLIEILVVVLVVSILMGVVVANFTGSDREQSFRGYAERLALKIEHARDRAMQSNREWGVSLDRDGVRFSQFDEINEVWSEQTARPFNAERFDAEVEFRVDVDPFPGSVQAPEDTLDDEQELPDIVLFSSGEATPFSIQISPLEWESTPWVLSSDGFSRTGIERSEFQ